MGRSAKAKKKKEKYDIITQFEVEFHIAFNGEQPFKEGEMTYSYRVCKDNLSL